MTDPQFAFILDKEEGTITPLSEYPLMQDTAFEALLAEEEEIQRRGENHRSSILQEADSLVNGDRNVDYGDPIDDFRRTANMWGAYLGIFLQPHDVAALMSMLKLSRIRWSPNKRDHWADLAGYAACGYDCSVREDLE